MQAFRSIVSGFKQIGIYFSGEVREIFRDSGAIVLFLLAMIVYPVAYAFGYLNETAREIPVAFVDLNHTSLSRKFGRMLDATEQVKIKARENSLVEAEDLYYKNEIAGIILVDKDFEKKILSGSSGSISVYSDAGHFLLYKQVYSATVFAGQTLGAAIEANSLLNKGKTKEQALKLRDPLSIKVSTLYNPSGGYASFIVPAIIIILTQQTLLIGIGLLYGKHNERRNYHFLRNGPRRPFEEVKIVTGQAMAFTLIYLVTTFLILGIFYTMTSLPAKNSFARIYYLLIPYLATVSFMGIGLGLLFSKRVYALVFLVFLSPILFSVSGAAWPATSLPYSLRLASYILPSTPMVQAFIKIRVMGSSLNAISEEYSLMLIQMAAYFLAACLIYKVKLYKLRKDLSQD